MLTSDSHASARYLALTYLLPGRQPALRRYQRLVLPVFRRHVETLVAAP